MNKARLGQIEKLFNLVRSGPDYLNGAFASAEDKEAALDLFEYETQILPAAWKMLDSFQTLHAEDKAALDTPLLYATRLRKIPDSGSNQDQTWEIGHLEKVLRQAQILEDLRASCQRCIKEP